MSKNKENKKNTRKLLVEATKTLERAITQLKVTQLSKALDEEDYEYLYRVTQSLDKELFLLRVTYDIKP
jgi:hypothetical protein